MPRCAKTLSERTTVRTKTGSLPVSALPVFSAGVSLGELAVGPNTQIASGSVAKTVVCVIEAGSRETRYAADFDSRSTILCDTYMMGIAGVDTLRSVSEYHREEKEVKRAT